MIPALLLFGLMLQACEPSPKDKLKQAKEDLHEAAEELMEAAEEVAEDLEEAADDLERDTLVAKKKGKKIKKLLGKLKKKK